MAAHLQQQNIKPDNWLAGLLNVMEDISAADDICRAANPAAYSRLLEQLQSGDRTIPARKQTYLA